MTTETTLTSDTIPVRETHRFDLGALERYLAGRIPGFAGPLTVSQFQGGQSNPTYRLSAAGHEYVLRRKPPGKLLPSAHAVDREYRILTTLGRTDVPVPKTYVLCEDPEVIGTIFYVMDWVEGRIMVDPLVPGCTPVERAAIYDSMNDVMARLHRVDWKALGLEDFGRPGSYFTRQLKRWTQQYRASETERIEAMEQLMAWLPEHIPAADETTVVHGDFRLGNSVIHPREPRIVAVLDWELATLGHPLADLAYNAMPYHLKPDILGGVLGQDLRALGIPTEEEYLAAYCRRTGRTGIPDWSFYVAFSMFRLSAIAQGIMGRVLAGTANDANARARGERARPMAEAGWAIVEARAHGDGTR
jgi:aminoglycoside phosphotransferase (APT) family kinase protein